MYVLYDKNEYEMDVITDLLEQENIRYITQRHAKEYIDCPFGRAYIVVYDILINTNYEKMNFIKYLADKQIKERILIEKCYNLEPFEKPIKVEIDSWAKSIVDKIIFRGN